MPDNPSEQRLERSMRVRNDPNKASSGKFTLNPGDEQHPSIYVEVLQEVIPQLGGKDVHSDIQLKYANHEHAQEHPFTDRSKHILTFRLDGAMAKP